MYRLPSIVAIETGVLRISPLFRPRTESRYCDPIFRPRRRIATFSRTIHSGGGFTSDMLGEYAGPFLVSVRVLRLARTEDRRALVVTGEERRGRDLNPG